MKYYFSSNEPWGYFSKILSYRQWSFIMEGLVINMSHALGLSCFPMELMIRTYNITLLIRNDGDPEFCPEAFFHWLHFFPSRHHLHLEFRRKNNFTTREMKLFSNLLKLSLAPFAVVLGLSEVPLGIRYGFKNPNSFYPFRRLKSSLKKSVVRACFCVGFGVLLLSTELQTELLVT